MSLIEHGTFEFQGHKIEITQEVDGTRSTTFMVIADTGEIITMDGPWDPTTRHFTRTGNYSNKIDVRDGGIVKLAGHIPYLSAEALGHMIVMGIINGYTSDDQNNRSAGTNKGLVYLQNGAWRERLHAIPANGGRAITLRRRY